MTVKKTTGLVVTALGLLALVTTEAAAQAPVLTATANNDVVTIVWTPLPGALGYNIQAGTGPGLANIASINLPASITQIIVKAPAGTYFLRVRGIAGSLLGPFSNEAVVVVGSSPIPPGCTPVAAPVASATTQGLAVTVNWNGVAGTLGYLLQFSRFPGGTELVQQVGAGTTSYQLYVGVVGTFYVRVVAGNACGQAVSNEVAFAITNTTGGPGPRTPDPPPGQLLPKPDGEAVVADVARRYPGDLAAACTTRTWLFRLLAELRKRDTRFGLNYKRGQRGSLSTDIITYNPTNRPDNGESQVYLFDVIGSICEGNRPIWHDVTQDTWVNRGQSYCGTEWCAWWTIDPYLAAGFPADPKEQ